MFVCLSVCWVVKNLGNGISSEFQVGRPLVDRPGALSFPDSGVRVQVSDYRVFVMVVVLTMLFMVSSTFGIILYLYKSRTLVL